MGTGGEEEDAKTKKMQELKKARRKLNRDPINWFGFLVPQALRQSQTNFIQSKLLKIFELQQRDDQ